MAKGGSRPNAGRKPKSEEQSLIEKLSPLEPQAFEALEEAIKDPKQWKWALPLYFGYKFGKPHQSIAVEDKRENPYKNMTDEQLEAERKRLERIKNHGKP